MNPLETPHHSQTNSNNHRPGNKGNLHSRKNEAFDYRAAL